jgi:phosphatidylglycerol:prolipoprotein diacylglycerol transferase
MVVAYLPGGIPIYVFSAFIGLGACLGLGWVAWRANRKLALRQMEAGMWSLLGGLVGGRIAFVAANWSYFQSNFSEGLQFYRGGLAWPGALAGGLLALAAFTALNRVPFLQWADDLLPLLAAVSVAAWLGCWVIGCAYGPPSDAWWSIPSSDEWGGIANRWPVQIWGAALTVGLFALIDIRVGAARSRPGYRALLALFGLSLILLATAFLRADPVPTWAGVRLDAWAAAIYSALALTSLMVYTYHLTRTKLDKTNNAVETEKRVDDEAQPGSSPNQYPPG